MVGRVLMVSKYRTFHGGVESHIGDLVAGLQNRGVDTALVCSEDLPGGGNSGFSANPGGPVGGYRSARSLLWNSDARRVVSEAVESFRPDLVHFHSVYHQLSPSVLGAFRGPRVMTLHDYKLAAPCYTLVRAGDICTRCVGGRFPVHAVAHRCVKGSLAGSLLCSVEAVAHRPSYRRNIDHFIVPSEYAGRVAQEVELGRPISVVPWGVPAPSTGRVDHATSPDRVRDEVLYAGRLHPSKGIRTVLRAWARRSAALRARLVIAGDGEVRPEVEQAARDDASVEYLGLLGRGELAERISSAAVCLVPSLAPETMGLSAIEALVAGTPVLSSGRGALHDLRGPGVVEVAGGDPDAWISAIEELLVGEGRLDGVRRELESRDLSRYTTEAMVDGVQTVYESLGLPRGA